MVSCPWVSQSKFVWKQQHIFLPWPSRKAKSCQPHLRPKVHVTSWLKASSWFSFTCHWTEGRICHAWFAIYFSGSIEVCKVSGISILCLVMFGVVLAADAFFFSKYLFWSIWVQVGYANSESSKIPFRVSCSKLLLLGLREGHSWPQLLEVRVSIDLVRVADAEDTGLWKDGSVSHVFIAIVLESKTGHMFFSPKYWRISMQSMFGQWWFWWYLIMPDVLRIKV